MFDTYYNNIVSCINDLSRFLCRDEKKREQIYLEEVEELLELTIKVFTTYYPSEKSFTISFNNRDIRINQIVLDNDQWVWTINMTTSSQKNLTSKELAHYFWEKKVSISGFLYNIFNKINEPLQKRLADFKSQDQQYEGLLESARQGKKKLELLLDDQLLSKIQLNQKDESENKTY